MLTLPAGSQSAVPQLAPMCCSGHFPILPAHTSQALPHRLPSTPSQHGQQLTEKLRKSELDMMLEGYTPFFPTTEKQRC